MSASPTSDDGNIGFQIAPMVDVVFVLLLFFMASAGSQLTERELTTNLPGRTSPPPQGITPPIILQISAEGQIMANGIVYDTPSNKDLPQLKAWLKDTVEKFGNKTPVIVLPVPTARHERIIDVLNAASDAGVTKLTFG